MEQIEHLRCKHRIRVLQGHEDTTKQNVVSHGLSEWQSGANLGSVLFVSEGGQLLGHLAGM